jgi:hypothetical protein
VTTRKSMYRSVQERKLRMRLFPRGRGVVTAGIAIAALLFNAGPAGATPVAEPAGGSSGAASVSAPAAATGLADCLLGRVCVWVNTDFSDGPGQWEDNESDYTRYSHPSCGDRASKTWNNCASSVYNHGAHCNIVFYDGTGMTGATLPLRKGSYLANLTQNDMSDGNPANDRFGSHRWFQCA